MCFSLGPLICPVLSDCLGPVSSTSVLTEEQLTTMSPTAAAVSKIKPGMKLTEVDLTELRSHVAKNLRLKNGLRHLVKSCLKFLVFNSLPVVCEANPQIKKLLWNTFNF